MSALLDVSIQQRHKVLPSPVSSLPSASGTMVNVLEIPSWESINGIFRYRRERCYRTVRVASVHRVLRPVQNNAPSFCHPVSRTCVLAVGYVGCDREDRVVGIPPR